MLRHTLVFALVCLGGAGGAGAQKATAQGDLETRLKSQFLMLRGMWDGEKLAFDAQGNLIGTADKTFFSLSAVLVDQVQLSDTQLEIRGRRAGLTFGYIGSPRPLSSDVANLKSIGATRYGGHRNDLDLTIALDANHPEFIATAIDRILSIGIDDKLAEAAPFYWQSLLQRYLHPDRPEPQPAAVDQIFHPGGGVTNPILKYAPDPPFSTAARSLQYHGISVIRLLVDENGMPQRVRIVQPLGMGLDECAVAVVAQYRFKPAIYQKHPVRVEINIEVNFR